METVFVYGTLKTNFYNHSLLAGAEFLGTWLTENKYVLLNDDYYPLLFKPQKAPLYVARKVAGECFQVDQETFEALDELEGNGILYLRERILVQHVNSGESIEAWAYFYLASEFEVQRSASATCKLGGEDVYLWEG